MFDSDGDFSGEDGDYVNFDFQSTSAPTPALGTYTFAETFAAGTFNQYSLYTYVSGGQQYQPAITGGSFTITASGIDVNLVCNDGNHSFSYNGTVSYSDESFAPARAKARIVKKSNRPSDNLFEKSVKKIRK
jgi:hypothetical protein